MSDDLPRILRQRAVNVEHEFSALAFDMRAAADEIERLRAELANVQWQLDFANDCLTKAAGLLSEED